MIGQLNSDFQMHFTRMITLESKSIHFDKPCILLSNLPHCYPFDSFENKISSFSFSLQQPFICKDLTFNIGLLFPLSLNSFQTSESHPYLDNPIDRFLEEFQGRDFVNKFLFVHTLALDVKNIFNFIFVGIFMILLLVFDFHIHANNRVFEWLHWKHDFSLSLLFRLVLGVV